MADKLKKERKSSVSTLIVQGYIIFFVFVIIVLIMQFKIIPMLTGIESMDVISSSGSQISGETINQPSESDEITTSFLYLLL